MNRFNVSQGGTPLTGIEVMNHWTINYHEKKERKC